jgi:DNA-directed RNA polymerase specialized sigma subunit
MVNFKKGEKELLELKALISKAKKKDEKAMEELFIQYKPLLKSRASRYSRYDLEYEDVFQQASLIFILAVYDFEEKRGIPFSGYIKKRINWELWVYYRKYLKHKIEISGGLKPKENHR